MNAFFVATLLHVNLCKLVRQGWITTSQIAHDKFHVIKVSKEHFRQQHEPSTNIPVVNVSDITNDYYRKRPPTRLE